MQANLHEQATTCHLDAVARSVHIDQKYIAVPTEAVLPEMQEWLRFVKEEQKSCFSLLFQL